MIYVTHKWRWYESIGRTGNFYREAFTRKFDRFRVLCNPGDCACVLSKNRFQFRRIILRKVVYRSRNYVSALIQPLHTVRLSPGTEYSKQKIQLSWSHNPQEVWKAMSNPSVWTGELKQGSNSLTMMSIHIWTIPNSISSSSFQMCFPKLRQTCSVLFTIYWDLLFFMSEISPKIGLSCGATYCLNQLTCSERLVRRNGVYYVGILSRSRNKPACTSWW